uniref:Uncharacterized protein n=1 Tax=Ditylenchus dipsaci TaxID=166011 RepID=A0A915EIC8_9BILA
MATTTTNQCMGVNWLGLRSLDKTSKKWVCDKRSRKKLSDQNCRMLIIAVGGTWPLIKNIDNWMSSKRALVGVGGRHCNTLTRDSQKNGGQHVRLLNEVTEVCYYYIFPLPHHPIPADASEAGKGRRKWLPTTIDSLCLLVLSGLSVNKRRRLATVSAKFESLLEKLKLKV